MIVQNLTVCAWPWQNGGWYTAIIAMDKHVQLVGPCLTGFNSLFRTNSVAGDLLEAIYEDELVMTPARDDGEEFLILEPGGILRDRRFDNANQMLSFWEREFESARKRREQLNSYSKLSIAALQEEARGRTRRKSESDGQRDDADPENN